MNSIVETLKRFNRKERYWVVRTALGAASDKLDPSFCVCLEEALADRGVRVDPAKAWWAMDFHFNWLFAALRMHCDGVEPGDGAAWENEARAVQGNQEDIDLIVVTGNDIILIEAKNGAWSRKQLRSKLERLDLMKADENGNLGEGDQSVRLHLVLMSPKAPKPGKLDALLQEAPAWMRASSGTGWRWAPLRVDTPAPDCRVHRSDAKGRKRQTGTHWTVAVSPNAGSA